MSLFRELQRRNVFRVAAAYVVVAWLLMQVGATLEPALHLPEWVDSLLAFFLILGFPIAMFLAWAYELTPEGLTRDREILAGDSNRAVAGRKWDRIIIGVLVLAVGYFALDKYVLQKTPGPELPAAIQASAPGDGAALETAAAVDQRPGVPDQSIAVLPFVNMSSDPEQEYFSDGLTEELLNLLAGIGNLKVAARTSSFYYKDKQGVMPFSEIAGQLEVAHILEGSVRKSGDRIRITAQLIEADDGFHIWSKTWDRTLDDIFAIQDAIAAAVVDELKIAMLGEAPHARIVNPESFQKSLEGRFLYNRRGPGDLEFALKLFEEAVALDPGNADAWIGLVPLYLRMPDSPRPGDARRAAERALALDPGNPEAHARMATVLWDTGGKQGIDNSKEIRALMERALELGPRNPLVLAMWAGYDIVSHGLEGAIGYLERALEADPLHIINLGFLSHLLINAGRLDEAEHHALRAEQLAPGAGAGLGYLGEIALLRGDFRAARDYLDQWVDLGIHDQVPGDPLLQLESLVEYSLGNTEAADAALQALIDGYGVTAPERVAEVLAWRGEVDRSFDWLERALEAEPVPEAQFSWSAFLRPLHADPRWDELVARWRKTEPGKE